ncbi:MAG: hypothetical protein PUA99_03785 [Roseburia hominis]|nr:hypothetical protein [Roseburia hominis]
MWTIQRLNEMDEGDEERLPGEPVMTAVTLESDLGEILQFQMPDNWLRIQGLKEGEEWPEDIEEENVEALKAKEQAEWMENYYHALQELEGEDE